MFKLLSGIFIKNPTNYSSPSVRRAYGMLSGILGILLNILLFGGKFLAGTLSGSIAITADAFNNLSDAGSSLITFFGFRFAGMKPDKEHPFGHGRIEYIAGLSISVLVLVMGVELGRSSIEKILNPTPVDSGLLPILILIGSIFVKLYMFFYNSTYGKKIDSASMRATGTDCISDALSTTVVLLSICINKLFHVNVDGWCGILVALVILYAGLSSIKDTITALIGGAPPKEIVEQIKTITMSYDEVVGIHDLVVHDYGLGRLIISLHAEVPCDMDMLCIHDIIDQIEQHLNQEIGCESIIHMDPIDVNNEKITKTQKELITLIKSIHNDLSIHDFRMVSGPTHTNLIFDVLLPVSVSYNESELIQKIQALVKETWPTFNCVIKVDHPYV